MPSNDHILQFHADLEAVVEAEVRGVAESVHGAWTAGGCDISKRVVNFLWYRNLHLREAYMANGGDGSTFESLRNAIHGMSRGEYVIDDTTDTNDPWNGILGGESGKTLFYATSPRIVEYMRPVLCAMADDFVLLTPCDVGYADCLPDSATVVRFVLSAKDIFRNELMAKHLPVVWRFANTIARYMAALKPRVLVCMDGCQTEYEMAALFCRQLGIPSVCMQQGWPSMLHEGFHDMPYMHFLTWGRAFSRLWQKRNPKVKFTDTGYLYNVKTEGTHSAITFFMQAPVFLLTDEYLGRMYQLVAVVAERYADRIVLVREHPEYRADSQRLKQWAELPNVRIVSRTPLADVYADTRIAVSCFSSSLMESVAHGCVPLSFCPTTGARYSPDIEAEGLGLIAADEAEFLLKLDAMMSGTYKRHPIHSQDHWFANVGPDAVAATIHAIGGIAK